VSLTVITVPDVMGDAGDTLTLLSDSTAGGGGTIVIGVELQVARHATK
jgi:hypothetical protein